METCSWSEAANADAPLNERLLQRSAEVQLRTATQTGRAINHRLNSAATNTAVPLIFENTAL